MKKTIFLILITILSISCEEDKENKENNSILVNTDDICGCDSISLYTIPELESLEGVIGIKIPLNPRDTLYNNKYWIGYNYDSDCLECIQSYIVCNDEIITGELKEELSSGASINIIFAGQVKKLCEGIWSIPERSYNSIVLTKIEKR